MKGLSNHARFGEIKNHISIDLPYEEPEKLELVVDTDQRSLEESVQDRRERQTRNKDH